MCEGSESIVENRALGCWSAMTLFESSRRIVLFEHDLFGTIHFSGSCSQNARDRIGDGAGNQGKDGPEGIARASFPRDDAAFMSGYV
jgi:hypothetical protein